MSIELENNADVKQVDFLMGVFSILIFNNLINSLQLFFIL
jgi:hypothetical protein